MSIKGVPSIASMPLVLNIFPLLSITLTIEIPIGFGLCGDRVVNKPCGSVSQGVLTRSE